MSVRRSAMGGVLAVAVVGMVAAYRLGRARADGVPTVNPLYYGGLLEDGGRPVEGTRNITVRLWDAASGGTAACTTSAPGTVFSGGRFRVVLDAMCAGAVRANPNLWAEVQVEATTFPRSKLGAVPYALEAGRASAATGALDGRIGAVEGRTVPLQLASSSWRPTVAVDGDAGLERFPVLCPTTSSFVEISGAPFSLTITASATALYQVRFLGSSISRGYLRVRPTAVVAPVATLEGGGPGAGEVYRLESGRAYTFVVQAWVDVPCAVPIFVTPAMPLQVQQLL